MATVFEDAPAGVERAQAAGLASVDGVVGDVPGTTVNDEGGSHVGKEEDSKRQWGVASGEWRERKQRKA
jgi:beta-phosphoglucomutase-like phosphatase (HAD superfamily)